MFEDGLFEALSTVQGKAPSDAYALNAKIHGACPYGCGRSCSGCEYSCQTTCSSTSGGGGGGCFITTAVCNTFNKPDDCHELTVLRKFRDEFMQSDSFMKSEVQEYYRLAPRICEEIDKQSNSAEIYSSIWEKWLKDAVAAVDSSENEKAHTIYKQMVLSLKAEYIK